MVFGVFYLLVLLGLVLVFFLFHMMGFGCFTALVALLYLMGLFISAY